MADPSYAPARVSALVFILFHWCGVVLSLCFVIFRLVVRIKYFHTIWVDDILIVGAWLMLLASAALWQHHYVPIYDRYLLVTGKMLPTPENLAAESTLLRVAAAESILFLCMLWTVKVSILIFFRRLLGPGSELQRIWWWCVMGLTVATWAIVIGTIQYGCLLSSIKYIFDNCSSESNLEHSWVLLHVVGAIDVTSDLMIITIPILILWNVRISTRTKLALMGISSLTAIVILFAIIRVAVMPTQAAANDISWLCTWSHLETTVAIIVSCLSSFRQLFVKRELSRQAPKPSADHSINSFLLGIASRLRCRFDGRQTHNAYQSKPLPSIPFKGSRYFRRFRIRSNSDQLRSHSQHSQISSDSTIPLNGIHVGRDIRMTSTTYPAGAPKPHAELSTAANGSPVS